MEYGKTNILNKVFTKNTLNKWISLEKSDIYAITIKRFVKDAEGKTNKELISDIYTKMKTDYRNEYYYKNTLLNKLLIGKHSVNTTSALTEVNINKSKADFVLINGKAVVYEIKTELDNLDRLECQIMDYYKAFNHVAVLTYEKNLKNVENIINNLRSTYDSIDYEDLEFIVDKIYESNRVCFAGNFFTQSVSMQLQIELSYLGKECSAMYPLQQQLLVIEQLTKNDLIIVSSIAGGFMISHPDVMRAISKSQAYKIVITQLDKFVYSDMVDMILQVGTDHHSLIGKFSITYIFEVLEAMYYLKYGTKNINNHKE